MEGNAYVFYHPQYGGLRVVNNEEGLFFCIEDLVAITDIGRERGRAQALYRERFHTASSDFVLEISGLFAGRHQTAPALFGST